MLPKEETDGKTPREVELCPGGKEMRVTSSNLPQYVYQLVKCRLGRPELQQCYALFAQGIQDVVPAGFLAHLTAEDLALLVNGVAEIPIDRLKKVNDFPRRVPNLAIGSQKVGTLVLGNRGSIQRQRETGLDLLLDGLCDASGTGRNVCGTTDDCDQKLVE
ncbi:unnamed protein product, partial [Mesorhabditis belari]|uniref:HECT domain-containing protein n=1 Tax=Mesorhabditis belari TaxID=2138241 RepID=A0AAF3F1H9_9BILA